MVFGGAMHPDQDAEHPWLRSEVSFIERALDARCADDRRLPRCAADRARGRGLGRAGRAAEVGWFVVEVNEEGRRDPVLGVAPRHRSTPSSGTTTRSSSPRARSSSPASAAARQAFRLGERAWGIQFHAEVDRTMLDALVRRGRGGAAEAGRRGEAPRPTLPRDAGTCTVARSATPSWTRRAASAR